MASTGNSTGTVEWQTKGHSTVSSYIVADGAEKVITFMTEVLKAHTMYKINNDDGTVKHASLRIGDSVVMISDASKDCAPAAPAWLHVYVQDVDKTYELALSKGVESVQAPKDEYYGDRMGGVKDSAGNTWWFATHKFNFLSCSGNQAQAQAQ